MGNKQCRKRGNKWIGIGVNGRSTTGLDKKEVGVEENNEITEEHFKISGW